MTYLDEEQQVRLGHVQVDEAAQTEGAHCLVPYSRVLVRDPRQNLQPQTKTSSCCCATNQYLPVQPAFLLIQQSGERECLSFMAEFYDQKGNPHHKQNKGRALVSIQANLEYV